VFGGSNNVWHEGCRSSCSLIVSNELDATPGARKIVEHIQRGKVGGSESLCSYHNDLPKNGDVRGRLVFATAFQHSYCKSLVFS